MRPAFRTFRPELRPDTTLLVGSAGANDGAVGSQEICGKRYGAVVVADDICFASEPRCCLGLIGPNGAGKSSLFNMLTGIVPPDGGLHPASTATTSGNIAPHLRARIGHCACLSNSAAVHAIERL